MKLPLFLSAFFIILFSGHLHAQNYCESGATDMDDTMIERVQFAQIDNTTNQECSTYRDFTSISATVQKGEQYELHLTLGSCDDDDYNKMAKVFVDWNGDGEFSDPGELILTTTAHRGIFTFSGFITISPYAISGNVRMRIVCVETFRANDIHACGMYTYGETQDYTLEILEPLIEAPVITSFTPETSSPQTIITLNGSGFMGTTSVSFNGTDAVFTIISSSKIEVLVPSRATSGSITITNPEGSASSTGDFIILPMQYCESGANFDGDTKINFVKLGAINNNTTDECHTYRDFSHLSTDVFVGQTFNLEVGVGTCGSEYVKVTKVFIDWNHNGSFDDEGDLVFVSDVYDYTTSLSAVITVPEYVDLGERRMRIVCRETDDHNEISSCGKYSYGETQDYTLMVSESPDLQAPVITDITPASGEVGHLITIEGEGFYGTTSVKLNGVEIEFYINSITEIRALVPAGATSGPITVINPEGSATSQNDFIVLLSYCESGANSNSDTRINFVKIGAIDNNTASGCHRYRDFTHLSTGVLINQMIGLDIGVGTCEIVKVFIDWNANGSYEDDGEVVFISEITQAPTTLSKLITVPANIAFGAKGMRVVCRETSDPDGVLSCGNYGYGETQDYTIIVEEATGIVAPSIANFSPDAERELQEVSIFGEGFLGTTSVMFNGEAAFFDVVSDTHIQTVVPLGATTGPITVTNSEGSAVSENNFVVRLTYCESGTLSTERLKINSVKFASVENNTSSGCHAYRDFSHISAEVIIDQDFDLEVETGNCGQDWPKTVKVYVDWNANGSFEDEGELVYNSNAFW
ncbi:MAG: GEVED domain-containing protein, partial [Cytophagaceae bacterium]